MLNNAADHLSEVDIVSMNIFIYCAGSNKILNVIRKFYSLIS